VSPAASLRGGIDLGGTKIQAAVIGAGGKVLGEARHPTPTDGGPAGVAAAMTKAMKESAQAAGVETKSLKGIGVGSPGAVDEKTGVVASALNLPNWEGEFPLGETLSKDLGAKVKLGNDVQVATNGEFKLGAGKPFSSVLGVFWGTGVGGGIILDGKPWLGRGEAGEIGHVVVKMNGAKCTCGRRGCMEAYAGRKAMEIKARKREKKGKKTDLFKIMEKKGHPRLTSGVWEDALKEGDKLAEKMIDRAIEALGAGVASVVNVLDVEAVIIGGGMGVRFGEPYAERIGTAMKPHLFTDENPPEIKVASLGDLGGAIGASLLIR
jgi:glucokinase